MAKAFLLVRSVVTEAADRDRFDRWYGTEHLPDAARAFGATRAWRGWSRTDPSVHYASYEFPSVADVERAQASQAIRDLIVEFDRVFPDVARTREVIELADEIGPAG